LASFRCKALGLYEIQAGKEKEVPKLLVPTDATIVVLQTNTAIRRRTPDTPMAGTSPAITNLIRWG
jgi:hypothetical protein